MDELVNLLDKNLNYVSHEIIDNMCYITVESNRAEVQCPFCGAISSKVHTTFAEDMFFY